MSGQPDDEEVLDELAESYVTELRQGRHPSVDDYAARYPKLADRIREILTTAAELESLGEPNDLSVHRSFRNLSSHDGNSKILGDYRLTREIGRGGMGIVYEAEQVSLGRRVALKVLPGHQYLDPTQIKRFNQEARAAARLQHTNIVSVYGVGSHEGVHYYAMQYIDGQGLDDVLRDLQEIGHKDGDQEMEWNPTRIQSNAAAARLVSDAHLQRDSSSGLNIPETPVLQPSCPINRGSSRSEGSSSSIRLSGSDSSSLTGNRPYYRNVAQITVQAADALHYAHTQKVLHRDIKPSNLLLDPKGNLWVTDFGLAKDAAADDLTHSGELVGTLRYMAPERFRGWCDPRSDVYSLGLTLYELLTLRPAFNATDRAILVRQVSMERPLQPRTVVPDLPRDLETIVLKAIASEPADRYQSADTFSEDLRRYLDGRPIQARRSTAGEQVVLWCRRNPMAARLSFAIGALLLTAVVVSSWAAYRFERIAAQRQDALEQKSQALMRLESAEGLATRRLYDSLIAQARAEQTSGRVGRHFNSMQALVQAAEVADQLHLDDEHLLALRTEAISSMQLLDFHEKQKWTLEPPLSEQLRLAFDADLRRYASFEAIEAQAPDGNTADEGLDGFARGDLVVRRLADQSELARFPSPGYLQRRPHLEFSPDGHRLAVFGISDSGLRILVWNFERDDLECNVKAGAMWSADVLAFAPSGHRLYFLDRDAKLSQYNFDSSTVECLTPDNRFDSVRDLECSTDGSSVAIAHRNAVEVIDLEQQEVTRKYRFDSTIRSCCWSPDGSMLGAASGNRVAIVDMAKNKIRYLPEQHNSYVNHVFFNHHGDVFASTTYDQVTMFWNPYTGAQHLRSGLNGIQFSRDDRLLGCGIAGAFVGICDVYQSDACILIESGSIDRNESAFHGSARILALLADSTVEIFDVRQQKSLGVLPMTGAHQATFSADGATLWTSSDEGILRWPTQLDEDRITVGPPMQLLNVRDRFLCAISDDESWFATIPADRGELRDGVLLHNVSGPRRQILLEHDNAIGAAFNHRSNVVATAARRGGTVKVWELPEARQIASLNVSSTADLEFSRDDDWLATGAADQTSLWNTTDWRLEFEIPRSQLGDAGAVAFGSDGSSIAVPDELSSVVIIDTNSREPLVTLRTREGAPIGSLTFASECNQLKVSTTNGTIEIWNLDRLRNELTLLGLDWSDRPISDESDGPVATFELELGDPWSEILARTEGQRALDEGRWKEALGQLGKATQLNPNDDHVMGQFGFVLLQLGQWQLATHVLNRALEIDPSIADYWRLRGTAYYQQAFFTDGSAQTFQSALADLQRSDELQPDHADTRLFLGLTCLNLSQFESGLKYLDGIAEKSEYADDIWEYRAVANIELGNYGAALQAAEMALQLNPTSNVAHRHVALASIYLGHSQQAIAHGDLALSGSRLTNWPEWLVYREIESWSKVIVDHPESPVAYYFRGQMRAQVDDWTDGLNDVRLAVELSNVVEERSDCQPLDLSANLNYRLKASLKPQPDFDPGVRTLVGIPFRIEERQILARLHQETPLEPISVGQQADIIHFLHNAHYVGQSGTKIAGYRIRYDDDTQEIVPLLLGENIFHWGDLRLGDGKVAWVGMCDNYQPRDKWVNLRVFTWDNPHPEKTVHSIEIVPSGSRSVPFVVAITIENGGQER